MEIDKLDWLVQTIINTVAAGRTPREAHDHLLRGHVSSEDAREALAEFERRTKRVVTLGSDSVLVEQGDRPSWYAGPNLEHDRFWPALRTYLLSEKGWAPGVVDSVDRVSSQVLGLMPPSGMGSFRTRGLVLGYVQSGKTANFTALIAKAADVGYRLFIVLSGIHNVLRTQTQTRLERELVQLNSEHWCALTSPVSDFNAGAAGNTNAFLTDKSHLKILCVVKKNAHVLRRLLRWLKKGSRTILGACPVLVIDDESDQAGVNSGGEDRTTINKLIIEVLETLPKAAYVGYTATPFANIFIDPTIPKDLYPRDFIVSLPEPDHYFGASQIFGREPLDQEEVEDQRYAGMLHVIDSAETRVLKPAKRDERDDFEPALTPGLADALSWFWLSCAVRYARGQQDQHMSMLAHTSMYVSVHEKLCGVIELHRRSVLQRLEAGDAALLEALEGQWSEESAAVPADSLGEQPVSWPQLAQHLAEVVKLTRVVVDNGRSTNRLVFPDDGARIQVVIGGNTLSRGLTIEGLTTSYFIRATTMYDTLLQMGRWFGYRQGYSDLPRIWMTEELAANFRHLATVEAELRQDIRRYRLEQLTPLDFALRVRTHPELAITARMKMLHAVTCALSYSGKTVQTTIFRHTDRPWLEGNLDAGRELLRVAHRCAPLEQVWNSHWLYRAVPGDAVLRFLERYTIHENHLDLKRHLLTGYIKDQNALGQLGSWNVSVISKLRTDAGVIDDLVPGVSVRMITRAALRHADLTDAVNLGVITSISDRGIDLAGMDRATLMALPSEQRTTRLAQLRSPRPWRQPDAASGVMTPLLLLYAVDPASAPKSAKNRKALDAVDTVLGLAIVFPESREETPQQYMTVDLSGVPREEDEPLVDDVEEGD